MDGAIGVAIGGIDAMGTGSKLKATVCLDRRRLFGTDNGWTVGRRTRRDCRIHLDEGGLDDEIDNEEGCSKVELEEMESMFTLPPPENPRHYRYLPKIHHHHHHHY